MQTSVLKEEARQGGEGGLLPVVTIDGLAGSGKTSLARDLAHRLGAVFFSSGVIYRGLGLAAKRGGVDIQSEEALVAYLGGGAFALDVAEDKEVVFTVDGALVADLFGPEGSEAASIVAQFGRVRSILLQMQLELVGRCAQRVPGEIALVAEGRDMGTVVYPRAFLKLFVQADPQIRLQRREVQMEATLSSVDSSREIAERDQRDTQRSVAPTRPAEDAIVVDNSLESFEKVSDYVYQLVLSRLSSPVL